MQIEFCRMLNWLVVLILWLTCRVHIYLGMYMKRKLASNTFAPLCVCATIFRLKLKLHSRLYILVINICMCKAFVRTLKLWLEMRVSALLHRDSKESHFFQIFFWCRSVHSHGQKESSNICAVRLRNTACCVFHLYVEMMVTHFACNKLPWIW